MICHIKTMLLFHNRPKPISNRTRVAAVAASSSSSDPSDGRSDAATKPVPLRTWRL